MKEYDKFDDGRTDVVIDNLKAQKTDVYDHLNEFVSYLNRKNTMSAKTLGFKVKAVRHFLEINDVVIIAAKFRGRVKIPRVIRREHDALTKDDIVTILNACEDKRLKSYLMFLTGTGFRAVEALSITNADVDLSKSPVTIRLQGENTKTKADRHTYLTAEMSKQLKVWLHYKYRERVIKSKGPDGKVRKMMVKQEGKEKVINIVESHSK